MSGWLQVPWVSVGPSPEFHEAELCRVDPRGVRRMGDIEAHTHFRLQAVGGHHRAVTADLLLDCVQADQSHRWLLPGSRDAFHHLSDDVSTDPVVQSPRNQSLVGKLRRSVLIDHRMPHTQPHFRDFLCVRGTDIDPEIVNGGSLFAAKRITAEMDRRIPNDAGDDSLVTENVHPRPRAVAASVPPTRSMRRNPLSSTCLMM